MTRPVFFFQVIDHGLQFRSLVNVHRHHNLHRTSQLYHTQHTMTNMWRLVSRTWSEAITSITKKLLSAHVTQWRYINRKPEVLVLSMGVIVDLEEHMASLNDSYFSLTVKSNGLL